MHDQNFEKKLGRGSYGGAKMIVIGVVVDLGPIVSGPWGCRTAIGKYWRAIMGI